MVQYPRGLRRFTRGEPQTVKRTDPLQRLFMGGVSVYRGDGDPKGDLKSL